MIRQQNIQIIIKFDSSVELHQQEIKRKTLLRKIVCLPSHLLLHIQINFVIIFIPILLLYFIRQFPISSETTKSTKLFTYAAHNCNIGVQLKYLLHFSSIGWDEMLLVESVCSNRAQYTIRTFITMVASNTHLIIFSTEVVCFNIWRPNGKQAISNKISA